MAFTVQIKILNKNCGLSLVLINRIIVITLRSNTIFLFSYWCLCSSSCCFLIAVTLDYSGVLTYQVKEGVCIRFPIFSGGLPNGVRMGL